MQRALGWERWGESTGVGARVARRWSACPRRCVAIGATVSSLVGLVAASIPDDSRVVVPEEEFTSTLFFLVQQQQRGVRVTTAPAARLAEAIDAGTDIVAFSAVQMSSGDVADVEAVVAAAEHRGARTVLDATQACGWMPIDATRFGAVVRAGYNWLTLARGTAFDDRL